MAAALVFGCLLCGCIPAVPEQFPPRAAAPLVRAVLLTLLAFVCFDLMAVLVRMLLARYAASELSTYRNIFGIFPSLLFLLYTRELRLDLRKLVIPQWRLAFARGGVVALAQLFFYAALGHMELATVSALGQTSSLFVVLLSIVFLGERVGPWRWFALGLGFLGAMWILRPGSDAFSAYAVMPVFAALCYAVSMITSRKFGPDVSSALLYLYSSIGAAVGAFVLALVFGDFTAITSVADLGLILAMATVGGCGVLLLTLSFRMAPPSALAPFSYFGIISSFLMGWVFFGELPLDKLLPGVLFIFAAGAIILWRENRRA